MHKLSLVLLLSFAVVSVGCGGDFVEPPQAAVSGKITGGKPGDLKGLGLAFTKVGSSASGNATIADDGTFTGMAPVGDVVVVIIGVAGAAAPAAGAPAASAHADASTSKLNKNLWDAGNTPWKVTVPADGKKDVELSLEAK